MAKKLLVARKSLLRAKRKFVPKVKEAVRGKTRRYRLQKLEIRKLEDYQVSRMKTSFTVSCQGNRFDGLQLSLAFLPMLLTLPA